MRAMERFSVLLAEWPWLAAEKLSVVVLVALAHGRCWPIFPARGRLTNFDLIQQSS